MMRAKTSGLSTRQFERESADLSIEFVIAPEHRAQVCFSSTSPAADGHTIRGRLVDVSSGGLGLVLSGFVPRMCEGSVRVFSNEPRGEGADGEAVHDVVFEHDVKVRRVSMHDRAPSYSIGVAFLDPEPNIEDRVDRLMTIIDEAQAALDSQQRQAADETDEERPDA